MSLRLRRSAAIILVAVSPAASSLAATYHVGQGRPSANDAGRGAADTSKKVLYLWLADGTT